jgi:hypothetical protein
MARAMAAMRVTSSDTAMAISSETRAPKDEDLAIDLQNLIETSFNPAYILQ